LADSVANAICGHPFRWAYLRPTDSSASWMLDPGDFRFDSTYPDAATPSADGFVLVDVLWSVGRSVKVKKAFLSHLVSGLSCHGPDPEQLVVVFKESQWESGSFAGGRRIDA